MYYAVYMYLKYPGVNTINLRYIYVEHLAENSIKLDRKHLDVYIKELTTSIGGIENSIFEKKTQVLCQYCDFQDYCDTDI
jgi:CRISPR/Cas system-associated exonuclease Cas4 (RecB family)